MFVNWDDDTSGNNEGTANGANSAANASQNGNDGDGNKGMSDEAAKLLKEVMEKKEALTKAKSEKEAAEKLAKDLNDKLSMFDGINIDEVKNLLKEKQDRETQELEKKGEWERVKATMVEQHTKELERLKADSGGEVVRLTEELSKRDRQIHELTIGRSFSESNFIKESLTLTPSKARVIYGSHFELKDGQVVAYDKPAGFEDRTPLVDASGNPLNFDKAIEKLIDLDPDRDNLLKSKMKAGAGSENDPNTARNKGKEKENLRGKDRIQAAIAEGKLPKLPNV